MGYPSPPPPRVNGQTHVKTLPSRCTSHAGGNDNKLYKVKTIGNWDVNNSSICESIYRKYKGKGATVRMADKILSGVAF